MNKNVYSINEVSELTGIGRTRLYDAINSGKLRAKKYGKRTLILENELNEFLNDLTPYQQGAQSETIKK